MRESRESRHNSRAHEMAERVKRHCDEDEQMILVIGVGEEGQDVIQHLSEMQLPYVRMVALTKNETNSPLKPDLDNFPHGRPEDPFQGELLNVVAASLNEKDSFDQILNLAQIASCQDAMCLFILAMPPESAGQFAGKEAIRITESLVGMAMTVALVIPEEDKNALVPENFTEQANYLMLWAVEDVVSVVERDYVCADLMDLISVFSRRQFFTVGQGTGCGPHCSAEALKQAKLHLGKNSAFWPPQAIFGVVRTAQGQAIARITPIDSLIKELHKKASYFLKHVRSLSMGEEMRLTVFAAF